MTKARDLSQTPNASLAFKNRIINGDLRIWQRGTSGFSNATYSADRWFLSGAFSTAARSTDVPSGFQFSLSLAGTSFIQCIQRIESLNSADLVGHSVTISFWAKQTTGATTNSLFLQLYHPNSSDNWSASTQIGSDARFTGTSGWTYYTTTFNNLPAGVTNGLGVIIGAFTAGSAAFQVTGVQLEKGSTATSFDYRPYGTELNLCHRYFYSTEGTTPYIGHVYYDGSGYCVSTYPFPQIMRATPSITMSGGHINIVGDVTFSSIDACNRSIKFFVASASGNAGYPVRSNFTASAEL